jgi:hypothetical protein
MLFDLVPFDNGPDEFHEGLVRVSRNGKMGYANKHVFMTTPNWLKTEKPKLHSRPPGIVIVMNIRE